MMNREILFRARRTDNGQWIYGYYLGAFNGADIDEISDIDSITGVRYEVDPSTVEQYTGLTDKNGVKIFEGDIVRYGDTIHEVVFEQRNGTAYFGLVYSPLETLPFGHYQDLRQITVIGNIHDNPELMEARP